MNSFQETVKENLNRAKIQYGIDPGLDDLDGTSAEMMEQFDKAVEENIYSMATSWTHQNGWGIALGDLKFFIFLHANGNGFIKKYVEAILEDCNFHTINELIRAGDYQKAYDIFLQENPIWREVAMRDRGEIE